MKKKFNDFGRCLVCCKNPCQCQCKEKILPEYIVDPISEEREKYWDKYYFINFYCSNCDRPTGLYNGGISVMILNGKSVQDVGILVCPNCRNLSLNK